MLCASSDGWESPLRRYRARTSPRARLADVPAADPSDDDRSSGTSSRPWAPARRGARRDRRGRGRRGPDTVAGPLTPRGTPPRPGRWERFDAIVLDVVESLERRWADELAHVEVAVEEAPVLPPDWLGDTVPLASVVRRGDAVRLVVFRRPIALRASVEADLAALVLTVVVEQVSELLGRPPYEIDPRYEE
jgi:hypothetical protein